MKAITTLMISLCLMFLCPDDFVAHATQKKGYEINGEGIVLVREAYDILQNNYGDAEKLTDIDEKLTSIIGEYKRELSLIPIKRKIKDKKLMNPITFSAFGIKLRLPWKEKDTIYRTDVASVIVKYHSWLVSIENPTEIDSTGAIGYESWKSEILDPKSLYTPSGNLYEFVRAILSVSSKDLNHAQNLLETVREKARIVSLLNLKYMYVLEAEDSGFYFDSIYFFEEPNIRGFQIGKPSTSKCTHLILFPNNNTELTIEIIGGKDGVVLQEHIDYIIRNMEQTKNNKRNGS